MRDITSSDMGAARHRRAVAAALFGLVVAGGGVSAAEEGGAGATISGRAQVVDADIIRFGAQRVILWGIDAPERRQKCVENGDVWDCYAAAKRALQTLVARGKITCYLRGKPDPFGRRYGVCESGEDDINARLVRAGLALAFVDQTDTYEDAQADAIRAQRGLWQIGMRFEKPWVFRRSVTPSGYR